MALSYLGEISYPLYMVHYPVFFAIYNSKIETYRGLVFVFAALMVSIAVHHWIDLPLRSGLVARNGRRVANPAV